MKLARNVCILFTVMLIAIAAFAMPISADSDTDDTEQIIVYEEGNWDGLTVSSSDIENGNLVFPTTSSTNTFEFNSEQLDNSADEYTVFVDYNSKYSDTSIDTYVIDDSLSRDADETVDRTTDSDTDKLVISDSEYFNDFTHESVEFRFSYNYSTRSIVDSITIYEGEVSQSIHDNYGETRTLDVDTEDQDGNPIETTITVDGQESTGESASFDLEVGEHTVEASAEDYETESETVTIDYSDEDVTLTLISEEYEQIPEPDVNIVVEDDEILVGEEAEFIAELDGASADDVNFEWVINGTTVGDNSQTHTHEFDETGEFAIQVLVTPAEDFVWPDGSSDPIEGEAGYDDDDWTDEGWDTDESGYDDDTEGIRFHTLTVNNFDVDENPLDAEVTTSRQTYIWSGETVEIQAIEGTHDIHATYYDEDEGTITLEGEETVDVEGDEEIDLTLDETDNDGVIGEPGRDAEGGPIQIILELLRSPLNAADAVTDSIGGLVSAIASIGVFAALGLGLLTLITGGGWLVWLFSLLGGEEAFKGNDRDR